MVSVAEARRQIEQLKEEMSSLKMDYHTLREMETIINRMLMMLERATGSKEIAQAINNIQKLISIIRMAQFTIHAFQLAAGPVGWAMFLTSAGVTAITIATMGEELSGT